MEACLLLIDMQDQKAVELQQNPQELPPQTYAYQDPMMQPAMDQMLMCGTCYQIVKPEIQQVSKFSIKI